MNSIVALTEGELDTQRSFFVESGRGTTRYIRVIRICFVKPYDGSALTPRTPLRLNYVTFEPLMVSTGGIIGIPIFESQSETMRRAMLWLSKTGKYLHLEYIFISTSSMS